MAPRRDLLLIVLVGTAAGALPELAARTARRALLVFGPNDADYVRGFRPEWEQDGPTRFRWTSMRSSVSLPLRLQGEGFALRMRVRRHFVEPATVTLSTEGRSVLWFEIEADKKVPYRTLSAPLPRLLGQGAFQLSIDAQSKNPRPLGFAAVWMELARSGPGARFALLDRTRGEAVVAVLLAFAVLRLAGLAPILGTLGAGAFLAAITVGLWWDILAAERILHEGLPAFAATALGSLLLVRWERARRVLDASPAAAAGLLTLVLAALALRLAVLLHPQYYYPDVKVHGLFAWQLVRRGFQAFMQDFTANQFRFSLGLQFQNGHWYAFPYPPGFYVLCWPAAWLRYRPEVAVSVVAAAVNSLQVLLVFALARRLRAPTRAALASASCVVVLPLFLARLTLAYFPAVVGHAADSLVLLYLLWHVNDLARPRVFVALGGLLAAAALTYTQSLLNFGLLLPLFPASELALDRAPGARARQRGLVAGAALGAVLAGLFYARYLPSVLDMWHGRPVAEERILLDKLERSRPAEEEAAPEEPDPFAGPDWDLSRGLRKAAWRLYVFYGFFAPLAVLGVALVVRASTGAAARLAVAWASLYLLLNLASGGLPGPNLVRYNKDLEIVAPLCCAGLGILGIRFWERARPLGAIYGLTFFAFGAHRCWSYLTARFFLEN